MKKVGNNNLILFAYKIAGQGSEFLNSKKKTTKKKNKTKKQKKQCRVKDASKIAQKWFDYKL